MGIKINKQINQLKQGNTVQEEVTLFVEDIYDIKLENIKHTPYS